MQVLHNNKINTGLNNMNYNKPQWAINAERIMSYKKITKTSLTTLFGVKSSSTITGYFKGKDFSREKIGLLAEHLGVSVQRLMSDDSNEKINIIDTFHLERAIDFYKMLSRDDKIKFKESLYKELLCL